MVTVVQTPHQYRIDRKPNIRRVFLRWFPFKVIFRDVEGVVQILAVSHKRRRPDYWAGSPLTQHSRSVRYALHRHK
jgi:toxin ParE1/3/4